MNNLEINNSMFENIKHVDEDGKEYWYARELMITLDYKRWDKFKNVIDNAKISCVKSNYLINYHFTQVGKMVEIGSKSIRKIEEYKLSRYACYLISGAKKEIGGDNSC